MISESAIQSVLLEAKQDYPDVNEKDLVFVILCDAIEDKSAAFELAYPVPYKRKHKPNGVGRYNSRDIKGLRELLKPYGIGANAVSQKSESLDPSLNITKTQNKEELMKLLSKIQAAAANGEVEPKDALKMEADIRVKLNDKFDMERDLGEGRRIIVVPQRHDYICPHTNYECSKMPSKSACMKFYHLKEDDSND